MSETAVYPVSAQSLANTHCDNSAYEAMYRRSVDDPDGFWGDMAREFLHWDAPWSEVRGGAHRRGALS